MPQACPLLPSPLTFTLLFVLLAITATLRLRAPCTTQPGPRHISGLLNGAGRCLGREG
ncbi:hypothetical protein BOTBODRAFT_26633 [Botryobasidium botryosum FD-172 SS1]|uniref:Uncharacterized protein n=1 Tax=Botryobasidium botryosum (strain FD-172 SS1) TaxID=930990 RepID=A0A067MYD3_BOTB1|nr:hypothetical protein BOTBODRAFT_26633 [Botryobasidium botryosum FD-172 SS1]